MLKPLIGISIMPENEFLQASYSLLEEGLIEAIEWSFDTLLSTSNPEWLDGILNAYSIENKLLGHGVYYSMFDAKWTQRQTLWLQKLKDETNIRKYTHISEHFGFMSNGNYHKGIPLPVSLNKTTLQIGIDRLKRLQDIVQLPVGVENLAFSFSKKDVIKQGEFIDKLVDAVDGFILLDLHNIYCQSHNFDIEIDELINCYPLGKVKEIHVSGGSWQNSIYNLDKKIRRDTHDGNIPKEIFDCLPNILVKCKHTEFIIMERLGNSFKNESDFVDFQSDFKNIKNIVNSTDFENSKKTWGKTSFLNHLPVNNNKLYNEQKKIADCLLNNKVGEIKSLNLQYWDTKSWDNEMINTAIEISKKWAI